MQIDTNTLVSITDAEQNFSKVTHIVDKYGKAVIFENNAPRYLIVDFSTVSEDKFIPDEAVMYSANKFMNLYDEAFKELAK